MPIPSKSCRKAAKVSLPSIWGYCGPQQAPGQSASIFRTASCAERKAVRRPVHSLLWHICGRAACSGSHVICQNRQKVAFIGLHRALLHSSCSQYMSSCSVHSSDSAPSPLCPGAGGARELASLDTHAGHGPASHCAAQGRTAAVCAQDESGMPRGRAGLGAAPSGRRRAPQPRGASLGGPCVHVWVLEPWVRSHPYIGWYWRPLWKYIVHAPVCACPRACAGLVIGILKP